MFNAPKTLMGISFFFLLPLDMGLGTFQAIQYENIMLRYSQYQYSKLKIKIEDGHIPLTISKLLGMCH